MKRFVCVLLIVILLVCAVGCDKGEPAEPKTPVGTWEYTAGKTVLVLHEGNSGELSENGKIYTVIWSYDKASHLLLITRMDTGYTYEATYFEDSDTIVSDGRTYRRASAITDPEPEPSQSQNASGIDFSHFYGHWVFMEANEYDGENGPPCTTVTINEDHTCLIDGVPGTWDGRVDYQIWILKDGELQFHFSVVERNGETDCSLYNNDYNQFSGWVNTTHWEQLNITMDNWRDYCDLIIEVKPYKNAFGELEGLGLEQKLVLKEEFAKRLVYEGFVAEIRGTTNLCKITVDRNNESYTIGQILESIERDPDIKKANWNVLAILGHEYIDIDDTDADMELVLDIGDLEFLRMKGCFYVTKP